MERMKTKIIIAVTERLRDARDTDVKTELIEELSENLYQRYLDLVANGTEEEEAYRRAMEDLGDVDELLDYLDEASLDDENADDHRGREHFNEFLRGMEDVVRETISQTKDAVDQAKVISKGIVRKFNEKYPDGIQLHCGYDKEKGGFFWESNGKGRPVESTYVSVENVKAIDLQLHNGDVIIHAAQQENVEVSGDEEDLEVRLNDDGVLFVRQGKTASSTVFFGRGLARTDVELTLPEKVWDFIRINTVNGDIRFDDAVEASEMDVRSVSGDIMVDGICCPRMTLTSVSGDITGDDMAGSVRAESKSGDISFSGAFVAVKADSMSGDVEFSGTAENIACTSMSGDVTVETEVLPAELNISSKSGDCCACIPGEEGFTVTLHTVSGDINTDFELVGSIGRKSGSAVYLDGGDRSFSISSISGDVSLERC